MYAAHRVINKTNEAAKRKAAPLEQLTSAQSREITSCLTQQLLKDPKTSLNQLVAQTGLSRTTVSRRKREILKIIKNHEIAQNKVIRENNIQRGCVALSEQVKNGVVLITDGESFYNEDPQERPPSTHFWWPKGKPIPDHIKYRSNEKIYIKKYLVWQAIDSNGIVSEPFIYEGTVKTETYLNECLKKILLPFIDKYHSRESVLFWPDLKPAHYAKAVTDWLKEENIKFVEKADNASRFHKCRPFEKYRELCKNSYQKRKQLAGGIENFKKIFHDISQQILSECGTSLTDDISSKLRLVEEKAAGI